MKILRNQFECLPENHFKSGAISAPSLRFLLTDQERVEVCVDFYVFKALPEA
jgi:hypothetical protein